MFSVLYFGIIIIFFNNLHLDPALSSEPDVTFPSVYEYALKQHVQYGNSEARFCINGN